MVFLLLITLTLSAFADNSEIQEIDPEMEKRIEKRERAWKIIRGSQANYEAAQLELKKKKLEEENIQRLAREKKLEEERQARIDAAALAAREALRQKKELLEKAEAERIAKEKHFAEEAAKKSAQTIVVALPVPKNNSSVHCPADRMEFDQVCGIMVSREMDKFTSVKPIVSSKLCQSSLKACLKEQCSGSSPPPICDAIQKVIVSDSGTLH